MRTLFTYADTVIHRPTRPKSTTHTPQPLPLPPTFRPAPPAPSTPEAAAELSANSLPSPLTLEALGLPALPPRDARAGPEACMPFKGGETAALARVKEYLWDLDLLKEYKETRTS